MTGKDRHLTDQELLLVADGELGSRQTEHVRQHLLSCWECRTRMNDVEATITEFVHLHHAALDPQIPPADSSRRMLKARLSEAAKLSIAQQQSLRFEFLAMKIACVVIALFGIGFIARIALQDRLSWHLPEIAHVNHDPSLPNRNLTPGTFQSVRLQDLCEPKPYRQTRVTSASLAREVLREYGMPSTAESKYEIDFLVIPELGGTENIQNLWPEPYSSTVWNAHVKDELEERLHNMVCEQKLDLHTAQHDIATNWISAYKKYFHTDRPLLAGSTS